MATGNLEEGETAIRCGSMSTQRHPTPERSDQPRGSRTTVKIVEQGGEERQQSSPLIIPTVKLQQVTGPKFSRPATLSSCDQLVPWDASAIALLSAVSGESAVTSGGGGERGWGWGEGSWMLNAPLLPLK